MKTAPIARTQDGNYFAVSEDKLKSGWTFDTKSKSLYFAHPAFIYIGETSNIYKQVIAQLSTNKNLIDGVMVVPVEVQWTDDDAKLLEQYVREKHTQEECKGFVDGIVTYKQVQQDKQFSFNDMIRFREWCIIHSVNVVKTTEELLNDFINSLTPTPKSVSWEEDLMEEIPTGSFTQKLNPNLYYKKSFLVGGKMVEFTCIKATLNY